MNQQKANARVAKQIAGETADISEKDGKRNETRTQEDERKRKTAFKDRRAHLNEKEQARI